MHGSVVARMAGEPRFLGREAQHGREPLHQTIEGESHHRARRAPAQTVRRVAIKRVLAHVEIEGRQIDRAEIMEGDVEAREIVRRQAFAQQKVEIAQLVQHIALELGQLRDRHGFRVAVAFQRAEQIAQRVAQAAIIFGLLLQDFRPDAQIFRVIGRDDPQAQNIGTVLLDDLLGCGHVAQRFRHFAALLVEHEAVG